MEYEYGLFSHPQSVNAIDSCFDPFTSLVLRFESLSFFFASRTDGFPIPGR